MKELRHRTARREALRLLRRFGLESECPVPVEDIAHALGIEIVQGELEGALASFTRVGRHARIRVSDAHVDPGQLRFSIAHELGHVVLGHSAGGLAEHEHGEVDSLLETEADAFAAELLLPAPAARSRCEVSPVDLDVIDRVAAHFGVTIVAAAIRFAELTSERCAVVYSQQRRVRWVVPSASFWPEIRRGQQLMPWSVADGYFARGTASRACESVDATAWVSGRHVERVVEIYEHSRRLDYVDAVLSLIWIPESFAAPAHCVA